MGRDGLAPRGPNTKRDAAAVESSPAALPASARIPSHITAAEVSMHIMTASMRLCTLLPSLAT